MDKLREYQSKRDFGRTREPDGKAGAATSAQPRFVIHKHAARRLHFDLRLEQGGVLKSWALPKGPSLKPGERRLAVQVEDHPLEYGDFEGVIPKGAYGGGTVMLWDRGHWAPVEKGKPKSGQIDFVLDGARLRGAWTLARMSGKANDGEDGKNWLLIKRRDAGSGKTEAPTADDISVLSGRTMARIAEDRDSVWTGDDGERRVDPPELQAPAGGVERKLPKRVRPQLATLVSNAPEGDDWLHEVKLDGYRLFARLENGRPQLLTRNDQDWTRRFPRLAEVLKELPVERAVLDGEAVVLGSDGISSFGRLQEALSAGRTDNVIYQAFDLLYLGSRDLTDVPLSERKQALAQLLMAAGLGDASAVRYSDHQQGRGPAFFAQACRMGLEGIICKRADSAYHSGRSKQWLKVKCSHADEFVVGGFTDPRGARRGFGSLLLGAYDADGRFRYSGRVGTGFSDRQLKALHDTLRGMEQDRSPFDDTVPDARGVHWVRPRMVVEIAFSQRTRDGRLRHPSFRGLREDRNAEEIRLPQARAAAKPSRPTRRNSGQARVAGVRLTHPQRVVYPELGLTKIELARWYEATQDWILPGLVDRPLALLRCLEGWNEKCFFQKHPREAIPDHVPRIAIAEKSGTRDYVYVRSVADLVALVQAGTMELHPWGSRIDRLEQPDRMVFDLDPGPDVPWSEVLRVARGLRARLDALGLASFVRTTGGKGLHLVVPLTRGADFDQVKAFAHAVSRQYERDEPRRLTTNMSKSKRHGRIFIDYLRNGRGATAIASYSVRARRGAPVAVPLRWEEFGPGLRSDRYTVRNLQRRLTALRADPWADFAAARRSLTGRMRRQVGLEGS